MQPRALFVGSAVVALAAVAAALYTQHRWDMMPCPWCILQRLILLCVAAAALVGAVWPAAGARRAVAGVMLLLCAGGAAAALWQYGVASASASCNMTLADRLIGATGLDQHWPGVFAAYASCAESSVKLLGVPYVFYSFAVFVLLAGAAVSLLKMRGGPRRLR
jgi:protein dithiol:quinone oxidoreductase